MKYADANSILKEIDKKYNVMSIKYKDTPLWPYLRIYLFDAISLKTHSGGSISNVQLILKSLFAYNPLSLFKRYNIWVFNGAITRKKLGDKQIHHVTGPIPLIEANSLNLESPEESISSFKKSEIEEKHIVSSSFLILFSRLIEYIFRLFPIKIEGEQILCDILNNYSIEFDYKFFIRYFIARRSAMDLTLAVAPHPKMVVMECPYALMGYVWSFHRHNIPVVEFQHGVLNDDHEGYNLKYKCELLKPDEICVYGEIEYDYFTRIQPNYAKKVTQIGLYILDRVNNYYSSDIFKDERLRYKSIIVVAGQSAMEKYLASFVDKVANTNSNILFIYIPRRHTPDIKFNAPNVRYTTGVNIYEYLKWCDIHMSVSSTTCLESQYFKKPSIIFDYEHWGSLFYGDILTETNGVFYIDNEDQFVEAYNSINSYSFHYRNLFVHDSENNVKKVIERYTNI